MTKTNSKKNNEALAEIRAKSGFICDMDGVIYHPSFEFSTIDL